MNLDHAKTWLDGLSIATVISTLAGYLPAVAALLSIVWTLIRIHETDTCKKMLRKWLRWLS